MNNERIINEINLNLKRSEKECKTNEFIEGQQMKIDNEQPTI